MQFENRFLKYFPDREHAEEYLENFRAYANTAGYIDLCTIKMWTGIKSELGHDRNVEWTKELMNLVRIVRFADGYALEFPSTKPTVNEEDHKPSESELPAPDTAPINITIITDDARNVPIQSLRQVFELANEYPERSVFITIN